MKPSIDKRLKKVARNLRTLDRLAKVGKSSKKLRTIYNTMVRSARNK